MPTCTPGSRRVRDGASQQLFQRRVSVAVPSSKKTAFLAMLIFLIPMVALPTPAPQSTLPSRMLREESFSTLIKDDKTDEILADMIHWLRNNGAFIDEGIQLRRLDPGVPTSPRGVFASRTFEKDDVLISIPWDLVVKPEDGHEKGRCGTVQAIHDHMKDGSNPYGRYLASQPRRGLPGYWSEEGRAFLYDMLGKNLPPFKYKLEEDWLFGCNISPSDMDSDELEVHALMLVSARDEDDFMIPLYDMFNHRNGKWHNTKYWLKRGQSLAVFTSRRVEAGEQLYNSYNRCAQCGDWKYRYGTPEIFGRYGFVESMPQRYILRKLGIKFDLDEKEDGSGGLEVKFLSNPSETDVLSLRSELDRLQNFAKEKKVKEPFGIPKSEWDAAWHYHGTLVVALTTALDSVGRTSGSTFTNPPEP